MLSRPQASSKCTGWKVISNADDALIHVLPVNDTQQHVADCKCRCVPSTDGVAYDVVIHKAFDNRERYQLGGV